MAVVQSFMFVFLARHLVTVFLKYGAHKFSILEEKKNLKKRFRLSQAETHVTKCHMMRGDDVL